MTRAPGTQLQTKINHQIKRQYRFLVHKSHAPDGERIQGPEPSCSQASVGQPEEERNDCGIENGLDNFEDISRTSRDNCWIDRSPGDIIVLVVSDGLGNRPVAIPIVPELPAVLQDWEGKQDKRQAQYQSDEQTEQQGAIHKRFLAKTRPEPDLR